MECETVRRAISDGDRRSLRARKLDGHLRACAGCRDFRALIEHSHSRSARARATAAGDRGERAAGRGARPRHRPRTRLRGGRWRRWRARQPRRRVAGGQGARRWRCHSRRDRRDAAPRQGPGETRAHPTHAAPSAQQRALSASPAREISASDIPAALAATHGGARLVHGHAAGAPTVVGSSTAAGALTPTQTQPVVGPTEQSREHLPREHGGRPTRLRPGEPRITQRPRRAGATNAPPSLEQSGKADQPSQPRTATQSFAQRKSSRTTASRQSSPAVRGHSCPGGPAGTHR